MPVNSKHDDYLNAVDRWETTRDAVDGQDAVKRKKTKYLPEFVPRDEDRYKQYLALAYYVNVTGRTLRGLLGAVFRKPVGMELPTQIEYLIDDADGMGQNLDQIAKQVIDGQMVEGRYGLMVDYPKAEAGMTREQVASQRLRASIKCYSAPCILNWKTTVVGSDIALSLVVLEESTDASDDEFEREPKKQYRVLRLSEGVYTQQMYGEDMQPTSDLMVPRDAKGQAFTYIPFYFVGAEDNTPGVDNSPLYDLANINLAHYRNIADAESALRVFSQISLHIDIGDTTPETWKEHNPNGVMFGSSSAIITQKGKVELVQASPHNFGTEELTKKEARMVSVGAKLISKEGINQTAEEARINASSEHSVLDHVVGNATDAMTQAIKACAEFMGADPEKVEFDINREFFPRNLAAQEIMAIIQLADRGDIAQSDVRDIVRQAGFIPESRTDEAIDEETELDGGI